MDDLKTGQIYYVNTESTDLRREPSMNSKTGAGQDNVILSMLFGSEVILESREVRAAAGHDWYYIRYVQDDKAVIGWTISDYLQHDPPGFIPVTGAVEVTNVTYNQQVLYPIAKLPSEPENIPQAAATGVTFSLDNEKRATTLEKWRVAAGTDQSGKANYPIPRS